MTGKAGNDFNNDKNKNNKLFIPFTNIFKNHYISENDFQLVNISENENQNKVKKYDVFFLMSSEKIEELGICSTILTDIPELYLNSFCKGYRITSGKISNRFLNYQLSGSGHRQIISTQGRGFTRINLRQESVLNTPVYFPSFDEQTQIANYLDQKTIEIDKLIAKKEQLIKLLEEERTAMISQAVTKGLDPNVPMKDSGIDWLGEIPEHWKLIRMRYLSDIGTGAKDTENREDDGEYPFFVRSQTIESISSYSFDGEAILTAGDGVGVCKVWHYINGKFDYHQRVYRLSDFRNVVGKYIFYYLKENFVKEVKKLSAKSTVDSLRRPMFQNFPIAFGEIEEQIKIVELIESENFRIDTILQKTSQEIKLLKEYKTALISEVVTGKIDIRQEVLN